MVDKEEIVFIMSGEWRGGSPSWPRSGFGVMKCTQKLSKDSSQEAFIARVSGITALTGELTGQ